MEYSKEFKQALSEFSSIEKDRLIFRLLKKDKLLSKKSEERRDRKSTRLNSSH